ncbi:MAG TPA: hypothetical protein EYO61_05110 [Campylobacterales bacterium]|nr:hypothetical protein [Campylobacterales bacterium]HIO70574.1 hypothetical protein [Campylobacterales bacterium]
MLKRYLEGAIEDLKQLIALTEADIADAKSGNHLEVFERASQKEKLVTTFEGKKKKIDELITQRASQSQGRPLDQILDEVEKGYLETLKKTLLELKEINRRYARLVVSLGTFYSSLLEKIVPTEMDGYETVIQQSASFLEIKG